MPDEAPPSTLPSEKKSRSLPWVRLSLLALGVYWVSMFVGSHIPPPPNAHALAPNDKLVHLCAYAGLTFLLLLAIYTRRQVTWRVLFAVAVLVVCYGMFDELTQPLFRRTADVLDLVADSLGMLIGLGGFLALRFLIRRHVGAG